MGCRNEARAAAFDCRTLVGRGGGQNWGTMGTYTVTSAFIGSLGLTTDWPKAPRKKPVPPTTLCGGGGGVGTGGAVEQPHAGVRAVQGGRPSRQARSNGGTRVAVGGQTP